MPYHLPRADRLEYSPGPLRIRRPAGIQPYKHAAATENQHVLALTPLWFRAKLDPKLHTSGLSNNLGNSGGALGCIAGFVGPAKEFGASSAHSLGLAPGSIWNHDRHINRAFATMPLNSNLERSMRPTHAGDFLSPDFSCLSDSYISQHMNVDKLS